MRRPGRYDALREAERQRDSVSQTEATSEITSPEDGPTRPTDHPALGRTWSGRGDMVSEQGAAIKWVKLGHAERQAAAESLQPDEPANEPETQEHAEEKDRSGEIDMATQPTNNDSLLGLAAESMIEAGEAVGQAATDLASDLSAPSAEQQSEQEAPQQDNSEDLRLAEAAWEREQANKEQELAHEREHEMEQ